MSFNLLDSGIVKKKFNYKLWIIYSCEADQTDRFFLREIVFFQMALLAFLHGTRHNVKLTFVIYYIVKLRIQGWKGYFKIQ